jgi:hypothetical protein
MHDVLCLSLRCAAAAGSSGPMQSPWCVLAVLLATAQAHARAHLRAVQISHGTGMTHLKLVIMTMQHCKNCITHGSNSCVDMLDSYRYFSTIIASINNTFTFSD